MAENLRRLEKDIQPVSGVQKGECLQANQVIQHDPPPNVVLMAPAEDISTDFMSYGSQSILVIKDRQSGFIAAKLTKEKTTQAAIEALKT